jgi:hypothetical protein
MPASLSSETSDLLCRSLYLSNSNSKCSISYCFPDKLDCQSD